MELGLKTRGPANKAQIRHGTVNRRTSHPNVLADKLIMKWDANLLKFKENIFDPEAKGAGAAM